MKILSKLLSVALCLTIIMSTVFCVNIANAETVTNSWVYDDYTGVGVNTDIPDQLYTGEPITPEVSVNVKDGELLELNKDYSLEYFDNVDVGIAKVVVTGLKSEYDSYLGFKKEIYFNIVPTVNGKNISEIQDVNLNLINNLTFKLDVNSSVTPKFETTDESVVTVDENGLLTAVGEGTADVTINASEGTTLPADKGSKTIKVTVSDYQLEKTDLSLYIGDNETLKIIPEVDEVTTTSWTSSDENIVTVDSNGQVVAKGVGKAVVTVKINDTYELSCNVSVKSPINKSSITLKAGQKNTISKVKGATGSLKFKSSNTKIAIVKNNGEVQGVKKGNATIIVTRNNCSINVSVSVTSNPYITNKGKTIVVLNKRYIGISGKVGSQNYSSSNKKIATVNNNGEITAKKVGKVTITAKTNGVTLKYTFTIIKPQIKNINKNRTLSIYINRSKKLQFGGRKGSVSYNFKNKKIAKYSKGNIVGKKVGSTKVGVKINGIWQYITVRVVYPTISVSKKNMTVCDRYTITTKGASGKYSSSDSSIVSVNKKNGKLVAKKAGKAVITVNLGSIKRKCTIKVKEGQYPYGYSITAKQNKNKINLNKGKNISITSYITMSSNVKDIYSKKNCSKKMYNKLKNVKEQFKYTTSDNKVVGVSDSGTLVPKKVGKATITVTNKKTKKNYSLEAKVTVQQWGYVNRYGNKCKMKYVYNDTELVNAFIDIYMNYSIKGIDCSYDGIHCTYDTKVKNQTAFYNKIVKLVSDKNATLMDNAITSEFFEYDLVSDENTRDFFVNVIVSKRGQKLYSTATNILNKMNLSQYNNVDDKYYEIFDWLVNNIKYDDEHAYDYEYTIVTKKGVCADFARSYQYLCLLAGLENRIVRNDMYSHVWNVIKTSNGKWYCSDATNSKIMFGTKDFGTYNCYKGLLYINNFKKSSLVEYNKEFYYRDKDGGLWIVLDKKNKYYNYT